MTWATGGLLVVALSAALAAGFALGTMRGRERLTRLGDSIGELARGNLAHRAILPGDDDAARVPITLDKLMR